MPPGGQRLRWTRDATRRAASCARAVAARHRSIEESNPTSAPSAARPGNLAAAQHPTAFSKPHPGALRMSRTERVDAPPTTVDLPDNRLGLSAALADRYRIGRELGAGGMATVYLAHDVKHDRDVALKVIRPDVAHTIGAARFLQEIRLAAKLSHPHILPLYDSGEADGLLFYVMPNVEGSSLRERMNVAGKLPIDEAVRIAQEVAGALDYAHRHGVVHRDVKPENIMLHEGQALVADFGIGNRRCCSPCRRRCSRSRQWRETAAGTGCAEASPTCRPAAG